MLSSAPPLARLGSRRPMENRKHKAIPATAALAAALVMYGVGPTDGAPDPPGKR